MAVSCELRQGKGDYISIGHQRGGVMWGFRNGVLLTKVAESKHCIHPVDFGGQEWRTGRYCPRNKVITTICENLTGTEIRMLYREFPEAKEILLYG